MLIKYSYYLIVILLIVQPVYANIQIHGMGSLVFGLNILLGLLLLFNNKDYRKIFSYKLLILYGLLVSYHLINCYFQGVQLDFLNNSILKESLQDESHFFMMVLVCFLLHKNQEKTLKFLIIGYLLYIILALNVVQIGDKDGRLRAEFIHPNQFAQAAGMAILIIVYAYYHLKLSFSKFIALSVLPVIAIIGCGSRNGFALLLIGIFAFVIGRTFVHGFSSKKIFYIIFSFIVIFLLGQYIINNTNMGERMVALSSGEETGQYIKTGTILDLLGERAIYYIVGWSNFLENPLFGIGLWNYQMYNFSFYPLHTEYMIHICEGGIFASSLYFPFIFIIFKNLIHIFRIEQNAENVIVLISFCTYLFIGITARELYYNQFYPILSLSIYHILSNKQKI